MACTALDSAYADGELDNAEYHSRMKIAEKAKTRGELYALLGDLQVSHSLAAPPSESAPAPPRGGTDRRRRISVGVTIAVVIVIGIGIIVIAVLPSRSTSRRPGSISYEPGPVASSSSPRPNYTPDDAALLQHLPAGYTQTNCYHQDPEPGEKAALHCDPYSGRLEAGFFLYTDSATLQQSYDDDRQGSTHTACADGALDNAYAAGRYECIMSNGAGVVPTVEWTSTQQNILGVYFASSPNGAATVLNWWKQHNQMR